MGPEDKCLAESRRPSAPWVWAKVSYLGRFLRLAQLILAGVVVFLIPSSLRAQTAKPQFVYIIGEGSSNIYGFQLNITTGTLSPVPGSPFNERSNPFNMAVDPAGKFLFVANQEANNISVFAINQVTGALSEVPNSPFASVSGESPYFLAVDPTSKFLFVVNFYYNPVTTQNSEIDVFQINSTTGNLTPSPNTLLTSSALQVPSQATGIFAHPNGQWLYVTIGANGSSIEQYQIDPATVDLTLLSSFNQAGENPSGLTGAPNGEFLFEGQTQQNQGFIDVLRISPVDGSVSLIPNNTIDVRSISPQSITMDSSGNFLYSNMGSFALDPTTFKLNEISLASTINSLPWAADPLGPFVFSTDPTGVGIDGFQINPATGTLTAAPGSPYPVRVGSGTSATVVTGYPAQYAIPSPLLSITSFAFDGTTVGTSRTWPIQLQNAGFATLNIGSISFTGANPEDFSQTNNCLPGLAPGASCTITAIFTPIALNELSALLTVTDNAAGSPQLVALSGEGNSNSQPVTFNPASLTFPPTPIGYAAPTQQTTLVNSGSATLNISSIGISGANPGSFSEANNCGATVPVNSFCTITVTFQPQSGVSQSANLTVVDDAVGSPHTAGLTGSTAPPVLVATVNPTTYQFVTTVVGTTSASEGFTLSVTGNVSLHITGVTLGGTNPGDFVIQSNSCVGTVLSGTTCGFTVAFKPQAFGQRSASLSITDDASSSPQTITLTGTANVPSGSFSPPSLTFSNQLVGTPSTSMPIQLNSTGLGAIDVDSVTISGANSLDFSQTNNCPSELNPGTNCTINVIFTPGASGSRTATLTVKNDSITGPISATLTGIGVNPVPAVTLAPTTFTFPSFMVDGTGASQGFALTNSGTGTLDISGIALTGANLGDFTQSNTCAATVNVSATCTITVTFKPQAAGVRTANVTITDNAPNSPQTIGLSGTGVPPFSLAPTTTGGTTVNLVPGQSSQYAFQFTSLPNFTGTVTFACMGAPAGSTCSVSPSSLPITAQTTTQLNLIVSSSSTSRMVQPLYKPGLRVQLLWVSWLIIMIALFLSFAFSRRKNPFSTFNLTRLRFGHMAILLALTAALVTTACGGMGGESTNPVGGSSGPAAGVYPLTVVATSGNITASMSVTLNVQ